MKYLVPILATLALLLVGVGPGNSVSASPMNLGPPPGAILDLDGQSIPHSYAQYTVTFAATAASTNLSFAFRDDPAFLFLDDVSVVDTTHPSGNLVLNGGFESGPVGANAPMDWTYLNTFGASFAGVVENNGPHSGSNNYFDGAVQAYDGITQALATTPGDLYTLTFWLDEDSGNSTFSRLSTNGDITDTGGNGIDLLVYAGVIPSIGPVPEPTSLALFGLASLTAGYFGLRRRKTAIA